MHCGGEVLVGELRSTVADDDIAIGSVADRCLLSGVEQKSHFKGVRSAFDPLQTKAASRYGARETAERQSPVRRQRSRRFAWRQREPTNPFATRPTQPGVPRDGARFLRRGNQTSSLAVRLSLKANQIS